MVWHMCETRLPDGRRRAMLGVVKITPTPRTPRPLAPKADAETTVAYTVRFDVADAAAIDALALELRAETGRRTLDRSEIIRALLLMADKDRAVRLLLVHDLAADAAS
jgi:hypothetical protein